MERSGFCTKQRVVEVLDARLVDRASRPRTGSASRPCRRRRSRRAACRRGRACRPRSSAPVEPRARRCRRRPRRAAATSPPSRRPHRAAACRARGGGRRVSVPVGACGWFGSVTVSSRSGLHGRSQRPLSHTCATSGSGGGDNDSHCAVAHLSDPGRGASSRARSRRGEAGTLLLRRRRSTKGAVCYQTNLDADRKRILAVQGTLLASNLGFPGRPRRDARRRHRHL